MESFYGKTRKNRNVLTLPSFNNFKSAGIRFADIQQVLLTLDGYEALRLTDYDGLEHSEAAEKMNIYRPTFSRLISNARLFNWDKIIFKKKGENKIR